MRDGRFPGASCPSGRRQVSGQGEPLPLSRIVGILIAAVAAVIAAMVSVFSGIVAYDPLRGVATAGPAPFGTKSWWPMLVYGPWMVASLSILRSALHGRRAAHSWCVVLFFSAVAMGLCIARGPRTVPDISAVALPAVTALTGFQQLVRQIAPESCRGARIPPARSAVEVRRGRVRR